MQKVLKLHFLYYKFLYTFVGCLKKVLIEIIISLLDGENLD